MKLNSLAIVLLIPFISFTQPNTEVYLLDIDSSKYGIQFKNIRNISNDPGYDNQPAFQSNTLVIFAGNNGGQTDIGQYSIRFDKKFWYHRGSASSQYSPQLIPNSYNVAAVHLDSTGYQRLFEHHITTYETMEMHPDLQVAYYTFYDKNTLVATVLATDGLDLVVADLNTKKVDTLFNKAGRSIHRVPKSNSVSYTLQNDEGNQDLYLMDMETGESAFVCQLPIGVQDYAWLNEFILILGSGSKLYQYDMMESSEWTELASFSAENFTKITRLAVSPDGKKLALVAEPKE